MIGAGADVKAKTAKAATILNQVWLHEPDKPSVFPLKVFGVRISLYCRLGATEGKTSRGIFQGHALGQHFHLLGINRRRYSGSTLAAAPQWSAYAGQCVEDHYISQETEIG